MSAFVVGEKHIGAMVDAVCKYIPSNGFLPSCQSDVGTWDADKLGAMLWSENVASVAFRYPNDGDGQRPGPSDFRDEHAAAYHHRPAATLTPVALLKALQCYEYQSCEHPGWKRSQARRLCDVLRSCLIAALPGYNEAAWDIS